ncbi:hypothetical protein GALMADRAFT_235340 [Galerina marginata CBS 339.88]|uniref:F-box domain-containing protein n=1 Tax=Galerina marginata (strain CBS 339.88) TaxID=685588 RepID=A0A067TSB1_GALM3|nr:hypothetical protein GALMADRAFT_235340 [Galerina marginata CBS 339.88]
MFFLDLPPELINVIFKFIDGDTRPDMRSLCRTCHLLRAEATPLLYSKVYIPGHKGLFRFAKTMIRYPELAKLVVSFHGLFYPPAQDARPFKPLAKWMQHLVNLKVLHLIIWHDVNQTPLPKCNFRLESLEISGHSLAPNTHILEDQNDLVFLSSSVSGHTKGLPSHHACRNLKILRGSIYTARAFLPGRSIISLEWEYLLNEPLEVKDTLLREISEPLGRLRSLSYRSALSIGPYHPISTLPTSYLHSLRFLEIQRLHPHDFASIATLAQLRVLLILGPDKTSSILKEPYRILSLFSKCPLLQRVDVGSQHHGFNKTCYRWVRGTEAAIVIPLHIAERGRIEYLNGEEGTEAKDIKLSAILQDILTHTNPLSSRSWVGSAPEAR